MTGWSLWRRMGSRFAEDVEVCLRDVDADQAQARGERDEQGCLGTSRAAAEAVHVAEQGCPGASAPAARRAVRHVGPSLSICDCDHECACALLPRKPRRGGDIHKPVTPIRRSKQQTTTPEKEPLEGRRVEVERQIEINVSHSQLTQIAQVSKRE